MSYFDVVTTQQSQQIQQLRSVAASFSNTQASTHKWAQVKTQVWLELIDKNSRYYEKMNWNE